jgi:uncharacterized membrane protein
MKYLITVLAVAGIVVSSMALRVHLMDPSAAPPCAVTEKFDCGSVNHGKYSVFPPLSFDEQPGAIHIPVAVIGIVGYALIGIIALMGRLRVVLELARIGFFCAAFLSFIEAYVITKWCIYCLISQIIMTVILLTTIVALVMRRRRRAASMREVLAEQLD